MAGHREEARLGAVGGIGLIARFGERPLALGALGDIAADALHFGRMACVAANEALAPGDPSRPERACDFLVVDAGAAGFPRGVALLKHGKRKMAADQRVAGLTGEGAKSVVDEGDAASRVAQHDQIVLRFEQAAGALLGFLQFPVTVRERFVVHGDHAQLPAHQAAAARSGLRARRRRSRTES